MPAARKRNATFALKAGVWFRRGRLLIVSPDSLGTACPLSGRNSTYGPVQILEASSVREGCYFQPTGRPKTAALSDASPFCESASLLTYEVTRRGLLRDRNQCGVAATG